MTHYRLATAPTDYKLAHQLFKNEGIEDVDELSFPTMLAWDDGNLVGVLSTHVANKMIIAGPMVIKNDKPRYWTLIRLIEQYERVMRDAGVTSFIFSVPVDQYPEYVKQIDKLGMKPYAQEGGRNFYVRNLE